MVEILDAMVIIVEVEVVVMFCREVTIEVIAAVVGVVVRITVNLAVV